MSNTIDLKTIRKQLPHGTIVQIAKKAKVNISTVSRALHGDKRSPKLPEITQAIAEYLAEYKAREQQAFKAMQDALKVGQTEIQ